MEIINIVFLPCYIIINRFTNYNGFARLFYYITVIYLSLNEIYDKKYYDFENINFVDYNIVGKNILILTNQFFLYDIFYVINVEYFIHHISTLIISNYCLYYKIYFNSILFNILIEISSIFLQLKYLITNNKIKKINNLLFMLTFLQFRIILIPILIYYNKTQYDYLFFGSSFYLLNLYWVYKFYIKLIK
tara:strand:+ start:623 stop:1192 length:570 start_codon:yes stop_codon:yes gene_type:complete